MQQKVEHPTKMGVHHFSILFGATINLQSIGGKTLGLEIHA
jgi:hypothetical protein